MEMRVLRMRLLPMRDAIGRGRIPNQRKAAQLTEKEIQHFQPMAPAHVLGVKHHVEMPPAPELRREFRAAIAGLPKTTEAERLIIQRVGQDIFRDRLMTYWQGRCPLTGITDPAL